MSTFAIFLVCLQACLVQNVFSGCVGPLNACGPVGVPASVGPVYANAGPGYANAGPGYANAGSYGGQGVGNAAVVGVLPVEGTTAVKGQVPIIGSVKFCGPVPAAGSVTITGRCNCGCVAAY